MNKHKLKFIAAICSGALISGCATQQGTDQMKGAGLGMVGGATLGCLIGLAAGGGKGCAMGAAIGAAAGTVAGWGAVKINQYQAEQVRTVQDDQRMYPLIKPVNSAQVKIRKGTSTPNRVRPGEMVKVTTDYSVTLPPSMQSTAVTEHWVLKKDGEVLADLPQQDSQRTSGGWAADATIPIPTNAVPGTYVIDHKVQAGTSNDTDESTFVVSR